MNIDILSINKRKIFTWLLYLLSVCVGLYGSLKVVITLFGIEADSSHSLMLWYGVRSYGLTWLKDWMFTQDNWLFSLVPFHFLGFSLFGAKHSIVILSGWLIFILSAFISGLMAWQLNAKRAAFLIPLTLLFLGFYAHSSGFVSYSTSHNITNLFGLTSLLLIIAWAQKQNDTTLLGILLLLVTGAISDPWMVAAYNLPIVLVSIILWIFPLANIDRINSAKLFFISVSSIVAVKTRFFGLLNFLPNMHFQLGGWGTINSNAILLIKDLGGLLNIFPFQRANDFITSIISIGLIALLLFLSIVIAFRNKYLSNNNISIVFAVAFFSIGGILLAFVLSSVEAADYSARFLLNCLYLIVIVIGVLIDLNWATISNIKKIFSVSLVALFFISGIISTFHIWKSPGFALKDNGINNLINFLQTNNLSYGYGPYWGSSANAVTAVSKSEIRIRPVYFNKANGMMMTGTRPESSRRWYTTEDVPSGQNEYFVFVKSDGEECADFDLCIKGLSKQFGDPSKVLRYGDASILVWNHPLIGYLQSPILISFNEVIYFDEKNTYSMGQGWSNPEKWGTWSDGSTSSVLLTLSDKPDRDLELLIDSNAYLTPDHQFQEVDVLVNNHHISTLKYDQNSNRGVRVLKIPKILALEMNGQLLIIFNIKDPKSPSELGLSSDPRRLGIGIVSLLLKSAN